MPLTSTIGERTALDINDPALSRRALTDWIAAAIGPQFALRADVKAFVDRGGCVQLAVAMQPLGEDSPPCLWDGAPDDCECFACAGWPEPVVIARVRATSIEAAKAEALQLVESEAALATLDGQGFLRWAERRRRT